MSIRIDYQEFTATSVDPAYSAQNSSADTASVPNGVCVSRYAGSSTIDASYNGYPLMQGSTIVPLIITMDFSGGITGSTAKGYARGITLGFDNAATYATRIDVFKYRGQIVSSESIYPESFKATYYAFSNPQPYDYIELYFYAVSSASAQVRLNTIYPGRVTSWTGTDLLSFPTLTFECEPAGTELPYDTGEFTLYLLGTPPRFKRWDKIFYYHNGSLIAKHYIDNVEREGDEYKVKTFSLIGVLDEMGFDGKYYTPSAHTGGYTVADCISDAINNGDSAEVKIAPIDIDSYFLSDNDGDTPEYNQFTGYIPHCSRREALHRVCQAAHRNIYLAADGTICMKPFSVVWQTISADSVFYGQRFEHLSPYTQLTYSVHSLVLETTGDTADKLYDGALGVGTTRIYFDKPCVTSSSMLVTTGAASITAFSYGSSYSPYEKAMWVDITVTTAGNVVLYGNKYTDSEAWYIQPYTTDADVATNELKIGGNPFYKATTVYGDINNDLSRYYARIDCKWTGKMLLSAFDTIGFEMGAPYSITILNQGTLQGWLTKAVITLSEANSYAEITLTGKYTEPS